jgi:hypothetical protein
MVMKKHIYILLIIGASICAVFQACKSAKKSLKRGDYDDSVLRAVDKLKSTPNHSSSLDILKAAYPNALDQHLNGIARNKNASDIFRWETEANEYTSLNRLYEAINGCASCSKAVTPQNFAAEEKSARQRAFSVRYTEGEKSFSTGTRESARVAYEHFEKANIFLPDYKDIQKKLDEAYDVATFKVVVEQVLVTSKVYQLSNAYFQDRINEFLQTNKRMNKFVRFYTPGEATETKVKPDHVITLQFDDFVVGQTLIEKNTETVTSKDSVKVSEKTVGKAKIPIYGKVTAKLTKSRKTLHSGGLLDMRIEDFQTRRIVNQEKFTGEYNWMCEWANYNGDERALTAAEIRMCKSQELLPPAPQELFVEFSKPIYDRLTNRLRTYYAKY